MIVICHPEMGVYLGNAMGLGFWSKLDHAGQQAAATFDMESIAIEHVASWETNNDPADYTFEHVAASDERYATVEDLKRGGLGHLLGEMGGPRVCPA